MFKLAFLAALGWEFGRDFSDILRGTYRKLFDKLVDTCRSSEDTKLKETIRKYDEWYHPEKVKAEAEHRIGF